jgi:hypothetical protein
MSARGSLKLFQDLEPHPQPLSGGEGRRQGRSPHLYSQRNECLIDRYYYYYSTPVMLHGHAVKMSYASILATLQTEFFIDQQYTIPRVLFEGYEYILKLRAQNPTKDFFKKKWPHFMW